MDEVLSVGDVAFSQKCFMRLDRMRSAGCTLLFASHDLAAIRKYCDQVLFLNHGRCEYLGEAMAATDLYLEAMSPGAAAWKLRPQAMVEADRTAIAQVRSSRLPAELAGRFDEAAFMAVSSATKARIGNGQIRILALSTETEEGKPQSSFTAKESFRVQILAEVIEDVEKGTFSIQVSNRMGVIVWEPATCASCGGPSAFKKGQWVHATFTVEPGLGPDRYTVDIGFGDAGGQAFVHDRLTAGAIIDILPAPPMDFMGLAVSATSAVVMYPGSTRS